VTIELPSVEHLRECFDLDSTTGTITWRHRPREHFRTLRGWRTFNNQRAGKVAGVSSTGGYLVVSISKKLYKVHRIIYSMAKGAPLVGDIDHIDGDPTNNCPSNLRVATPTQNQLNKRGWRESYTGVKGVYPKDGKFCAKLRRPGGVTVWLGVFNTLASAKSAHSLAVVKYHGEFGRYDD